ncbi:MAG: MAPEG family protein [Pseudomonadota bacterium]
MNIAIVCIALNAMLVFLLGLWVSIQRTQEKVIYAGETLPPNSALAKAQRAHANAAEYAGAITALFLLCSFTGTEGTVVLAAMIAITAARYLAAFGFLTCRTLATPHWAKALGAIVTYLGGITLAVYLAGYGLRVFGPLP